MKVIICGAWQVAYGIAERLRRARITTFRCRYVAALIAYITETLDVRVTSGTGQLRITGEAGAISADMLYRG